MTAMQPLAAGLAAAGVPDPDADWSLPGWLYHDLEYYAVEMARVIRPSWQIVCHTSNLANPGDWRSLDYLGESVIVIRGEDGAIRGFTNVCRHRAMRLVDGHAGCAKKLVCPYHAWVYETDGRLSGVPMRGDYPALKLEENGLAPVAVEVWHGFVFVRLEDSGFPSVAEMMAPFEAEAAPYRLAEMRCIGEVRQRPRACNWKNVGDNYSDNLHIPVAHDGLSRFFGRSYRIEAHGWADRLWGDLDENPPKNQTMGNFWERVYAKHLPRNPDLPEEGQRRWLYYKLWPNIAFDICADQVDFMQWLPTGPTTCVLREMSFAHPDAHLPADEQRRRRLVRYANNRVNRVVNAEDTWLIERVQAGMRSASYAAGPIGASEVCLRSFAAKIRSLIPEARLHRPPAPGWSRT